MSLTKLAASTAHLLMAVGFARITWSNGYVAEMWVTYGAFAIGHALADKTAAQIKAFKDKKLEAEAPPGTVTTATVTTKETTSP